jgi:hypothetical protein
METSLDVNVVGDYELIETVPTQLFARTMVFDPKTKNIYLLTAEVESVPSGDPAKPFSRKMRVGSFCVLVMGGIREREKRMSKRKAKLDA